MAKTIEEALKDLKVLDTLSVTESYFFRISHELIPDWGAPVHGLLLANKDPEHRQMQDDLLVFYQSKSDGSRLAITQIPRTEIRGARLQDPSFRFITIETKSKGSLRLAIETPEKNVMETNQAIV